MRFPIFSSSAVVLSKERLSPCSITSGINIPVTPRVIVINSIIVLITARVLGNLSFNLKNKIMGLAINAIIAAMIM